MKRFQLATILFLCSLFLFVQKADAGKYNPKSNLGDKIDSFPELPAVDGKKYTFSSFPKAKIKVLAFTCNSCPYAVDYEDRLNQFYQKYCRSGEVALIAINSNLTTSDSMKKMKERAKAKKFKFPYLLDESQKYARNIGALRTPEFIVLDSEDRIIYLGAFDDSSKADQVKKKYVPLAVEANLSGKKPEISETPPIGCLIRFKRSRKK